MNSEGHGLSRTIRGGGGRIVGGPRRGGDMGKSKTMKVHGSSHRQWGFYKPTGSENNRSGTVNDRVGATATGRVFSAGGVVHWA